MPPPSGTSWEACCQQSIILLKDFVDKIHSYQAIQDWNIYFQVALKLPHPNPFVKLEKEVQPKLFCIFPEACNEIRQCAN